MSQSTGNAAGTGRNERMNRLADASSPYLQQHARNPVDWYPWGDEALSRARELDRPIFLSIGYSACHWCHVMERESFEDDATAALLNHHFVAIKVDREERPDLDAVYMEAVQLLTGAGGWPLSVFLTPGLEPFYGGTYFPPEDRHGLPGFRTVLTELARMWEQDRDRLDRAASQITAHLRQRTGGTEDGSLARPSLEQAVGQLEAAFDTTWGGFGAAPKFPAAGVLELLLRCYAAHGDDTALNMALQTLDAMARGGIYDHVGGGFHRYSVDRKWIVPHFEKMLYDNALLVTVYVAAYQLTGHPSYRRVARETLAFIEREMTDDTGGFHATLDADSEGGEGHFYVWNYTALADALPRKHRALMLDFFGATRAGNFEGRNILHTPLSRHEFAERRGISAADLDNAIDAARSALLDARGNRPRPGTDDKLLTDWNALMISAFAKAAAGLGDKDLLGPAQRAATFLRSTMMPDGDLHHVHRRGKTCIRAYLDDYAYAAQAFLDLFQATGTGSHLETALELADDMVRYFRDDDSGGFFFTAPHHRDLISREMIFHDASRPSGNAVAAAVLLRLARLTDRDDMHAWGVDALKATLGAMQHYPIGHAHALCALDFHLAEPTDVVVVGSADQLRAFQDALGRPFLPNVVRVWHDPASRDAETRERHIPLLRGRTETATENRPMAFVCRNRTCGLPVSEPEDVLKQLINNMD